MIRFIPISDVIGEAPHICRYITSWEEDDYFYIQMEYCFHGSVSKYIERVGVDSTEHYKDD